MKRVTARLGLFVLFAAALAGCSPPQNPIVGKWQSAAEPARTVEFCDDGTFHSDTGDGRYKFPDASHIILVPEAGDLFSSLKTIKMNGDTLVLTDTDARRAKPETEKLRRIDD